MQISYREAWIGEHRREHGMHAGSISFYYKGAEPPSTEDYIIFVSKGNVHVTNMDWDELTEMLKEKFDFESDESFAPGQWRKWHVKDEELESFAMQLGQALSDFYGTHIEYDMSRMQYGDPPRGWGRTGFLNYHFK